MWGSLMKGTTKHFISNFNQYKLNEARYKISEFNSLAPGKFEWNFYGWGISWEIALWWMSLDFTDDQSTLVQVMAWCRQATSHYLSQCWPRSMSPYGVTRPQWVKGSCSIFSLTWLLSMCLVFTTRAFITVYAIINTRVRCFCYENPPMVPLIREFHKCGHP